MFLVRYGSNVVVNKKLYTTTIDSFPYSDPKLGMGHKTLFYTVGDEWE